MISDYMRGQPIVHELARLPRATLLLRITFFGSGNLSKHYTSYLAELRAALALQDEQNQDQPPPAPKGERS